jgi:hypothetical protein
MEITMYESKKTPGKRFGSIFAGKKYDEDHTEDGMHSESPMHEAKETPEFEAGEKEGMKPGEQEEHSEEVHPMVAEHGKAHKIVISHDHKAGRHTVQSHHTDGHVHTNVHDAAHKAHDEARELAEVPATDKNTEKDSMWHEGKGQAGSEPDKPLDWDGKF